MDELDICRYEPPFIWLKAYEYCDRKKTLAKKKHCFHNIVRESPFYSMDDIKMIKLTSLNMKVCYDVGIFRNLRWDLFKVQILNELKTDKDNCSFDIDKIQDLAFTNSPIEKSAAISEKHDLFAVIPDNVILFISQIKIDNVWIYYK